MTGISTGMPRMLWAPTEYWRSSKTDPPTLPTWLSPSNHWSVPPGAAAPGGLAGGRMIQKPIACSLRGGRRIASVLIVVSLAVGGGRAHAQIVLDGKFGTSGALTGPNYNITAAMGSLRGNNLFQSFSQFNLVAGDVATFSGPANVQNVLSRVTGGNPSSINGTIRSTIQGANFFFINPSGILFGPNAAVDVSGAFAASTANYLKLANGAKFVASLDADDSMLSTDPVVAFG